MEKAGDTCEVAGAGAAGAGAGAGAGDAIAPGKGAWAGVLVWLPIMRAMRSRCRQVCAP